MEVLGEPDGKDDVGDEEEGAASQAEAGSVLQEESMQVPTGLCKERQPPGSAGAWGALRLLFPMVLGSQGCRRPRLPPIRASVPDPVQVLRKVPQLLPPEPADLLGRAEALRFPARLLPCSSQPRLRDDPEKVIQTIRGIFHVYNPTWADMQ